MVGRCLSCVSWAWECRWGRFSYAALYRSECHGVMSITLVNLAAISIEFTQAALPLPLDFGLEDDSLGHFDVQLYSVLSAYSRLRLVKLSYNL